MVRVDGVKRTRGQVGRFGAGDFGDEPRGKQRLQDLLRELGGDSKFGGDLQKRGGRFASLETLADEGHQPERDEFTSALVDIFNELVLQIRLAVLPGIRDLRAEQQNHPRKIKSDHEHRHQAEAAVNLEVGDDARNIEEAEQVVQMPQ